MEGETWNTDTQSKFQTMLIQYKQYGAGVNQFYNGLTNKQIALMESPNLIAYHETEAKIKKNIRNYINKS